MKVTIVCSKLRSEAQMCGLLVHWIFCMQLTGYDWEFHTTYGVVTLL